MGDTFQPALTVCG